MDTWQALRVQRVATAAFGAAASGAAVLGLRALRVLRSAELYSAYWQRQAASEGELLYVALGDSAAQGVGASHPALGYVGRLAEQVARRTGRTVQVVNLSVSGAMTADLVREQLPQLAAAGAPDLVTVAIGGNDAGRTGPKAFRAAFVTMLDALPRGSYVADVPDFGGGPRKPAAAALASIAREELARRPSLVSVELEEATGAMRLRDYSADFFHPGDSGYRMWADAFWREMAQRLPDAR